MSVLRNVLVWPSVKLSWVRNKLFPAIFPGSPLNLTSQSCAYRIFPGSPLNLTSQSCAYRGYCLCLERFIQLLKLVSVTHVMKLTFPWCTWSSNFYLQWIQFSWYFNPQRKLNMTLKIQMFVPQHMQINPINILWIHAYFHIFPGV